MTAHLCINPVAECALEADKDNGDAAGDLREEGSLELAWRLE